MRCNFRAQPSTATKFETRSLSSLTRFGQLVVNKTRIATLVVLLELGGGCWITTEVLAPQIAQAYTDSVDLSLDRQPNETYEGLVHRAEAAATAAAQASFGNNIQVTDVAVMIVAQNQGAIAPVLSLQVSRTQWQNRPDPQRWAKYFTNAKALLRFEGVATTTTGQTGAANPTITPGGTTNSYSGQTGTSNSSIRRGRSLNRYPSQTGQTGNGTPPFNSPFVPRIPGNIYPGQAGTTGNQIAPGQPANIYPGGQSGTTANPIAPGQPSNIVYPGQAGNANPVTPSQSPSPGSGLIPQAPVSAPVLTPGNTPTSTRQNTSSPGLPSISTPANVLPTPLAPPGTGGTTINTR